jgi:NosR/NirI family transcriptional regulator, nitrous oxide reductase regulator
VPRLLLLLLLFLPCLTAWAQEDPESTMHITGRHDERTEGINCDTDPCSMVLPGAVRFEKAEEKPYVVGYDASDDVVGWVVLSTDVVDIKGYSGKPLYTLVGLNTDGVITGGRVVHHSEPILLVGIPESKLHDFVSAHAGRRADRKVVLGGSADNPDSIDVVSGATVTVLVESRTILEAARAVAEDVGVIDVTARVPGHFVEAEPWTWQQLVDNNALGHLVVSHKQMNLPPPEGGQPFVDIWFGIADAPQVGIPLLGHGNYTWAMKQLAPGEHLFVVFNNGTYSYKGSGFVRGGIFDRFRVEQGLRTLAFRDMDYTKLSAPKDIGAPELWEGGLFVARSNTLDPGMTYQFTFLGSTYAMERGAFERDFARFELSHRSPRSIYQLDGPDPESAVWRAAWAHGWPKALFTALYFVLLIGLFVGRGWLAADTARLKRLHTTLATLSFVGLGLVLHVQPSVTQLLTLVGTTQTGWDWSLFLSDPVLFVSWIGIAIVTVVWGRGVFCGWMCPYGSLNELSFKIGRKLGLPNWELPDWLHGPGKYLRYVLFFGLLSVFLWDSQLGEMFAEVEPFKSTFFVPLFSRHWGLVLWWFVLFGAAFTTYRPFCRYICPLGAALALPTSFRASGPYRREFCSKCKICTKGCEPRAIRPDGTIDPRECLNCWECEANWQDDNVCPPLVKIKRDKAKQLDAIAVESEAT